MTLPTVQILVMKFLKQKTNTFLELHIYLYICLKCHVSFLNMSNVH